MPFCRQCGEAVDEAAKFCPACGAPTGGEVVRPPADVQPRKKASRRWMVFSGLTFIVIVVVIVIVVAVATSGHKTNVGQPSVPGGFSSMDTGQAAYFQTKPLIASVTAQLTEQVGLLNKKGAFDAANDLVNEIDAIRKIAGSPILLGDLTAKHTMASAVKMRNDLISQLHITKLQADAIASTLFHVRIAAR